MDDGLFQFLRREHAVYNLSSNAIERIISRGLGKEIQKEISITPVLPLVNSEAHVRCSDVDVTKASVAFGQWAIPKLKRELLSTDPLIAKKAIMSLLDMVHDPEKAVETIRLQVVPRLVRLMMSEDIFVKQHILMILEVLAMQPGGKMAIVHNKSIMRNLSTLFSDPNRCVRLSAVKTVRALAMWYLGIEEIIKHFFICTIIHQLNAELDDTIIIILLEILEMLLDQNMEAKQLGLDNECVELAVLLEHSVADVRAGAASVIAQIARLLGGKQAILQQKADIFEILSNLLEDPEVKVRIHAAAALMFVMCTTEGKLRCLKSQTPLYLIRCAQIYSWPGLQINAIKALTSMAESPEGQAMMKNHIQLVRDIRPADAIVQRHRDILVTVINRTI